MKKEIIINDFVVKPEKCNFSCDYCLSNEAPSWMQKREKELLLYTVNNTFGKNLCDIINKIDSLVDATILRISGGDLFAIKNIEEFLIERTNYEAIQVITNGYYLQENILESLKKISQCHIHMSLDGHDLNLNGYRVKSKKVQQRLLDNLNMAVELGFHVEIGSVLTNANVAEFRTFLEYLLRYENKVTVYPFPVRGNSMSTFLPSKIDVEKFKQIFEDYNQYKNILAHEAYIKYCIFIMEGNRRKLRCHIPEIAIQSFENGNITACPNSWSSLIGNVNDEDIEIVNKKMQEDKMKKLFLQPKPRVPFCKQCYTSLDILNLYFEGYISDDEMGHIPLYSGPRTIHRLMKHKKEIERIKR